LVGFRPIKRGPGNVLTTDTPGLFALRDFTVQKLCRRGILRCWQIVREAIMPQRIDDARQWRERAEEARDLAEQLKNPESKRILLGIAVSYVALAKIAEERDKARRGD
jgi:hypothetical protein